MGHLGPDLGIICGMAVERRALGVWARHPRVAVAVTGADPARASAGAETMIASGVRMLLSWGVAGGLVPADPGRLVLADAVVTAAGDAWPLVVPGIIPEMGAPLTGTLLGSDDMVLRAAEKRTLAAKTGAVAVDMESHRVARVAARARVPMVVVRAIGDPVDRDLPEMVVGALDARGRPRVVRMLWRLLHDPGKLGALRTLDRDTRAGLAALDAIADRMIPALLDRVVPRTAPPD